MYLFNSECWLQHYATPYEILKEFYTIRLKKYEERMIKLRENIRKEVAMLDCKHKFVCGFLEGTIAFVGRKKADLIDELKKKRATAELDKLDVKTAKSLWLKDLEALEAELCTRRECWELVLMYGNYRVYYTD
ncbi:hypothetical protein ACFX15_046116 [Malus domestica]